MRREERSSCDPVRVSSTKFGTLPKIARVVTLGCRLNIADSALMFTSLTECGYRLSEDLPPDVVVVNTCAVTAEAERKTRQAIRKVRREFPAARIVAAGCAADANAPVGHASMHLPHSAQLAGNPASKAVATRVAKPRFWNPSSDWLTTSLQILTQTPHLMHLPPS